MENQPTTIASGDITWHTDSFWTSADTSKIMTAMVKFHAQGVAIPKNGTASITSSVQRKYMLLDDILTAVRPALASVGCYMEQHLAGDSVITRINHESGQFIASKMHYVTWEGGAVNNLMKMGGGLSYLRRYAAAAILALPADEDTDADGVDHMSHKSSAQGPANAPKAAPASKAPAAKADGLPWLNLRAKDGTLTVDGKKAIEYIESRGTVANILTKYRLNKADRAELDSLEAKVLSAHYEHQHQASHDDSADAPF